MIPILLMPSIHTGTLRRDRSYKFHFRCIQIYRKSRLFLVNVARIDVKLITLHGQSSSLKAPQYRNTKTEVTTVVTLEWKARLNILMSCISSRYCSKFHKFHEVTDSSTFYKENWISTIWSKFSPYVSTRHVRLLLSEILAFWAHPWPPIDLISVSSTVILSALQLWIQCQQLLLIGAFIIRACIRPRLSCTTFVPSHCPFVPLLIKLSFGFIRFSLTRWHLLPLVTKRSP